MKLKYVSNWLREIFAPFAEAEVSEGYMFGQQTGSFGLMPDRNSEQAKTQKN